MARSDRTTDRGECEERYVANMQLSVEMSAGAKLAVAQMQLGVAGDAGWNDKAEEETDQVPEY